MPLPLSIGQGSHLESNNPDSNELENLELVCTSQKKGCCGDKDGRTDRSTTNIATAVETSVSRRCIDQNTNYTMFSAIVLNSIS